MTALYTSDIDCLARRMLSNANWLGTYPFDQAPLFSTVFELSNYSNYNSAL